MLLGDLSENFPPQRVIWLPFRPTNYTQPLLLVRLGVPFLQILGDAQQRRAYDAELRDSARSSHWM